MPCLSGRDGHGFGSFRSGRFLRRSLGRSCFRLRLAFCSSRRRLGTALGHTLLVRLQLQPPLLLRLSSVLGSLCKLLAARRASRQQRTNGGCELACGMSRVTTTNGRHRRHQPMPCTHRLASAALRLAAFLFFSSAASRSSTRRCFSARSARFFARWARGTKQQREATASVSASPSHSQIGDSLQPPLPLVPSVGAVLPVPWPFARSASAAPS